MRTAVIGLGIMGSATAERLLEARHEVTVNNRSRAKADHLIELGAHWADSPAGAARNAEVIITMVKDPQAVKEVTLGEDGILSSINDGAVHAEMSTVSPQSAREIAQAYASKGKQFVQAPVLGSKKQIQDSTLLIMAGGNGEAISACQPAWQAFSSRTWTLETAAQAAALKLACNMLIAQMILGLGQSMLFASNNGVDPAKLLDVLEASALGAPMYMAKGKSLLQENFRANFSVSNMLKDLGLASEAAKAVDASLVMNDLARRLFQEATGAGLGDEDYSAVVKMLGGGGTV